MVLVLVLPARITTRFFLQMICPKNLLALFIRNETLLDKENRTKL